MKTENYNHIYDCILNAIIDDYDDDDKARVAASSIFTRLLTASAEEKQDIIDEYELECCRVCEICGELMVEGWMLDATVVCSDECAAKFFGESVEKFRYRMSDENFIKQAMEWDHCQKKYEDLTEEERRKYLDDAMNRTDFYWTEWE
jgi:hypothetical protein